MAWAITEVIASRPVFADQTSAALWPCQRQIAVHDGLVDASAYQLRTGDGMEDTIIHNPVSPDYGGTLLQVDRTTKDIELPAQLTPPGAPSLGWGHVDEVIYAHPVGLVDLHVTPIRRAGWTRLPTLNRGTLHRPRVRRLTKLVQ